MKTNEEIKNYANEAVEIIKDMISDNQLVKGDFINNISCSEDGHTIFVQDVLNYKTEYSLSEVSYIFTDYLDCFGDINKNVFKTVLSAKKCENYKEFKDLFIKSLSRLKEIEQCV
ncbi:MAG: hypothetical protein E7213_03725 [Clostridium sp.]|jgi:hypothetical protein|nr:hypothetical protein [Clostridium sp.]